MRHAMLNPISVTVALCVLAMAYLLVRPAPDRSLNLTLVFPEQAGESSASAWRNAQEVLSQQEAGAEVYVIAPDEMAAYEWSVSILHLTPAGEDRLRARFGGGDMRAVAERITAAQPGFVLSVGDTPIVAGVIAPVTAGPRYFSGQMAEVLLEDDGLRFGFRPSRHFIESGTIADRRLLEATRANGLLVEDCTGSALPFELHIARQPGSASPVFRAEVSDFQGYVWPTGSFTLTAQAYQTLIETLDLPPGFGDSHDSSVSLALEGFFNGQSIWVGRASMDTFMRANDDYPGLTFRPTVAGDQLTFENVSVFWRLDNLRGLRNLCVRQAFADVGRLMEAP